MDVAARFEKLLEHERVAAISADLAALEALQGEKSALLTELERAALSPEARDALFTRARRNLSLMRNLVDIHRELAGAGRSATYDAGGRPQSQLAPEGAPTRRLRVTS